MVLLWRTIILNKTKNVSNYVEELAVKLFFLLLDLFIYSNFYSFIANKN